MFGVGLDPVYRTELNRAQIDPRGSYLEGQGT